MAERRVCLIQNPASGRRGSTRDLEAALHWLRSRGWQVERRQTRHPGHARELAADAAARGVEVTLVCGGDGTINEAVNGIAGTGTALAIIPAGTVNLWAKEMGIPRQARAAVRLLEAGERRRVDLGRANGRYFLMLASAGADSRAVQAVTPARKRRWGRSAYLIVGLYELVRHGGRQMTVTVDGERFRGRMLTVIAGNTRLYGGVVRATYRAQIDDGLLDLCIYGGRHRRMLAWHALWTSLQRHDLKRNVVYRRARRIRIESEQPLPLQLDGDPFGATPAEIEVVEGGLLVIVPPVAGNPLFGRP